ncbi:MAG: hypothetical protein EOP81_13150 [Variovorax sp.]|nr:MAG: hypothetical protein EOP81_13150 [Variovorax sp.]
MKKLLVLVAMAAALTACSKKEEAPAAAPAAPAATAPAAAPATAPAPAAPVASTATAADLPSECTTYLEKVSTCVSKQSGAAADAMKASMDQTKSAWAAMGTDKAALGAACKAADDAFAAQATAMKC